MNFKKDKYAVIKQAIPKELAEFLYNYFLMKKQVAQTCLESKFISPFETLLGRWDDQQVPNTYSHYSDIAMETLMLKCLPLMEKTTGLKLVPTYSYARIYKKGDVLPRHKDRSSCEISTTLHLGGDEWPIFMDPTGATFAIYGKIESDMTVRPGAPKGIKIDLKPGDMLLYRGQDLEHWRKKFKGKDCAQVFLHYNDRNMPGAKKNMFDKRPHLGLPNWFKR